MAVDMFLKIEGEDIKGEAKDSSHKEEIDVLVQALQRVREVLG